MMIVSPKKWLTYLLLAAMMFTLLSVFAVNRNNKVDAATTSFRFVVMGEIAADRQMGLTKRPSAV